jgi:N4-gp56 family major capsid protein
MLVTRADIPQEYSSLYMEKFLRTAQSRIVYLKYAQDSESTVSLPENGGSMSAKWRRWENLAVNTNPLGEGITPEGSDMSVTEVTGTALQYGNYIRFSDVVKKTSMDPIITKMGERLAYNMQQTLDTVTRTALQAGSNFIYAGAAVSKITVGATDYITTTMIRKAVRFLEGKDAMTYMQDMILPSTGISTTPIPASFIGITHTDIAYTIRNLTGFIPIERYARPGEALPGEIGSYAQVRFIATTQASIYTAAGATSQNLYGTLIFGTDAFGAVNVDTLTTNLIINELGSGGSADPLHQRGTVGWKAAFAAKILNSDFMVELISSAEA